MITQIAPNRVNLNSRTFDTATRCEYHSNVQGHNTEDCLTLKEAIEKMIQEKRTIVQVVIASNVIDNPLPKHENFDFIEMIYEDKEYDDSSKSFGNSCYEISNIAGHEFSKQ